MSSSNKGIVDFTQEQEERRGKLIDAFNNVRYSPKDLGLTRQQLVAWQEEGLLDIESEEGQWVRFNLVESVWVLLLLELRSMGYPLAPMKQLKEGILTNFKFAQEYLKFIKDPYDYVRQFPDTSISNGTKFFYKDNDLNEKEMIEQLSKEFDVRVMRFPILGTTLFTYIEQAIIHEEVVLLAINKEGDCMDSVNHAEYKDGKQVYSSDNLFHKSLEATAVVVSISKLLYRLMGIKPAIRKQQGLSQYLLNENEEKIMNILRSQSKKTKSLKLTLSNGEVKYVHIEAEADSYTLEKAAELLAGKKYQSIELKVGDGNITAEKKISIKL